MDATTSPPSGLVAIVGRPNVGKSTLFNRLTMQRRAIVDEEAGLTRDRLYGVASWRGRAFSLVDTAGLDTAVRDFGRATAETAGGRRGGPGEDAAALAAGIQGHARAAISEADACLFLLDVREGVTAADEDIAAVLRRGSNRVVVVGNKADSPSNRFFADELHGLGLGEPVLISALQGKDTGDLLDRVLDILPAPGEKAPALPAAELAVAIVGRPNVGKSALLNALTGEPRALVSPVAGTTRDTVDTIVVHDGRPIRLVDTAGIRRRGVVSSDVEHYSVLRALRALERSDVGVVVVDAAAGVVAQDRHVAGYAADAGKALVIVANKWDLLDHESRSDPALLERLRRPFDFVPGVPVLATSAVERRGVGRVLPAAVAVAEARATRVSTGMLNTLLRQAVDARPPAGRGGRRVKLLYAAQASTPNPTIVLFVNDPELLHFSYRRYLENRIRAGFGFAGVPLRIVVRRRSERLRARN